MVKKWIYKIYCLAGGAFLLSLLKYCFVDISELSPKYFIVEMLSFGLFLVLVYFFDKYIRVNDKLTSNFKSEISKLKDESNEKMLQLENTISSLSSNKESVLSSNELEAKAKKIISSIIDENDLSIVARKLLETFAKEYEIGLGVCYFLDKPSRKYVVKGTYGLGKGVMIRNFALGEGLNGQAVADKKCMVINDVDDDYFYIESCSGKSRPKNIYLLPIVKGESIGLIEIATFVYIGIEKHWEDLNTYVADAISL